MNTTLTPAELDALEALSLDATDAPWAHDPNDLTITTDPFVVGKVISVALCELDRKWNSDVEFEVAQINAKLIAASRNALPALIAMARECLRLRDEIKALEDENESLEDSLTRELSDPRPRRPWTVAEIKEMGR